MDEWVGFGMGFRGYWNVGLEQNLLEFGYVYTALQLHVESYHRLTSGPPQSCGCSTFMSSEQDHA